MKEIKENLNKWRNIPCSWIGRLNLVKMSVAPKLADRFAIPIKIPNKIFVDIAKLIPKFICKDTDPRMS